MEDQGNYGNSNVQFCYRSEEVTAIPNDIIRDKTMPAEAFRILTYLISFADDKITPKQLKLNLNLTNEEVSDGLEWLIQTKHISQL